MSNTLKVDLREVFEACYSELLDSLNEAVAFSGVSSTLHYSRLKHQDLSGIPVVTFGSRPSAFGEKSNACANYLNHVYRYSVLAAITSFEQFLLVPYLVLTVHGRPGNPPVSFEEAKNIADKQMKKSRHEHVVDLLQEIAKNFDVHYDSLDDFQSIRKMRNCLAHRSGRIGRWDLNGEKTFEYSWPQVKLLNSDGVSVDPFLGPFSGNISVVGSGRTNRSLRAGDEIVLSSEDCYSILWALLSASREILEKTENIMKRLSLG